MKKKSAGKLLLLIPLQLVLSILIIIGGVFADEALFADSTGLGHAAPAFTLIAFFLAIGLFVIVTVCSIIGAIVRASKNKKNR